MKTMLLIFALTALWAFPSHSEGQGQPGRDPGISHFAVTDTSAIRALLQLSGSEHLPMGIIEDDDTLCRSAVTYSAENTPASVIIDAIVKQVPGYLTQQPEDSTVFLITPASPRPVTTQFLSLVDHRFGPTNDILQVLEVGLWVHLRYLLYPKEGNAGSILSSTNARRYKIDLTDATAQQILNRVAEVTKGAWVLRPLPPTLAHHHIDEIPFSVFSDDGQGGRMAQECAPVQETERR